jgi:hypothetical protein
MAKKKAQPYSFVLEELSESALGPRVRTKPMFGALAIYVDQKIVFILRKKEDPPLHDDGIWVAMQPEHNTSVKRELPALRPIAFFAERAFYGWLNLPEEVDGFEEAALHACRLVIAGDPRFGKIPKGRAKKARKIK